MLKGGRVFQRRATLLILGSVLKVKATIVREGLLQLIRGRVGSSLFLGSRSDRGSRRTARHCRWRKVVLRHPRLVLGRVLRLLLGRHPRLVLGRHPILRRLWRVRVMRRRLQVLRRRLVVLRLLLRRRLVVLRLLLRLKDRLALAFVLWNRKAFA
jgi:hypothetical protein